MTAYLDLVAGWSRIFSSHQRCIPLEYYDNEAGEEKSFTELLATFREYWGNDAVDKAIKHVEEKYYPDSEYLTPTPSRTESDGSVAS